MTVDTQYHCSIKPVSRAAGRSSVAAAAYRSATLLCDERTGIIHDYTRKRGVILSEVVAPPECGWALDRGSLWNVIEGATRKNGRVASEVEVALPHALTDEQRAELVRGFAAELAAGGVAVDYNIHAPHPVRRRAGAAGSDLPGDDDRNYHAHILCSHLPVTPDGPGKPVSKLFDGPERVEAIRERWAEHVNAAYARAGLNLCQDARSYAAQGIDRTPTRHLGPTVIGIERRGARTERGDVHRARAEKRRAELAIAHLDGEQKRRTARHQRSSTPATPKSAPQLRRRETPAITKYTPRGRVTGRGGRPLRRTPRQDTPKHQHEQTDDLRVWLWSQAYAPAAMPRRWLLETTAMWTFGRDGDPDGIYVQLADGAGRLYDNGSSVTWDHAGIATNDERELAIEGMLNMAVEGRGWTALSFCGDQKFREEAARQATRRGITCSDADLQGIVETERRRIMGQPTPVLGAVNGITQTTSTAPAASITAAGIPTSLTVAAFLAAGREAGSSGHSLNAWLSLYAMRIRHVEREEIAAHFASQPAGAERWARATDTALTIEALIVAQQRGDVRALRGVLDVTPAEQRRVVSDVLHARADAVAVGSLTDLAGLRRRSGAQALAQSWDRMSDEVERAERDAARVEESPRPPVTAAHIRALCDDVLSAKRAERDRMGDPLDTVRAERALTMALDLAPCETRRTFADALTGKADALTLTLAVAAMAAANRVAGHLSLSEKGEDDMKERAAEIEAPRPV